MVVWAQNGCDHMCKYVGKNVGLIFCPASPESIVSSGKRSKFKVKFLLNSYSFHTIIKSKTVSQTIVSQGPSI